MVALIVLSGMGFALLIWLLGYQFLYWSYFDPDKPYLPDGSEIVINFVTGSMGAAFALVAASVTAVITWKVAQKSMRAGQDAALSGPDNNIGEEGGKSRTVSQTTTSRISASEAGNTGEET